jgi:hypothetical protein
MDSSPSQCSACRVTPYREPATKPSALPMPSQQPRRWTSPSADSTYPVGGRSPQRARWPTSGTGLPCISPTSPPPRLPGTTVAASPGPNGSGQGDEQAACEAGPVPYRPHPAPAGIARGHLAVGMAGRAAQAAGSTAQPVASAIGLAHSGLTGTLGDGDQVESAAGEQPDRGAPEDPGQIAGVMA